MSKALVIVDVQKEFDEFIQHDLVDALSEYAEKFDTVYQIWDTHNNTVAPTHSFPGQIDSIPKKFGKKHFSDEVTEFIKSIEDSSNNGRTFKLSDEEGYVVRVKNNHDWFYVNPEIVELISELKGKKVILSGGADGECLEDIYQAFLAFGLNTHINKKYTYSAKTSDDDSIQELNTYESTDTKYNKIAFCPKTEEELINAQEIAFKNDWVWAGGRATPFTTLQNNVTLVFDKTDQKIRRTGAWGNDVPSSWFVVNDIDHLTKLLLKRPTYEPKKFVYEEVENDKLSAKEICVEVNNKEEYEKLGAIMKKISERYHQSYTDHLFREDRCPYFYFIRMDKKPSYYDLVTYYNSTDVYEYDRIIHNAIEEVEELDGVYDQVFSVNDERSIISSIMNSGVTITPNTPSYEPKKFIYEEKDNDKSSAKEICIKVNNQEEYNKLEKIFIGIGGNFHKSFLTVPWREDKCPYFFFIRMDKLPSHYNMVTYYNTDDSESQYMSNGNMDGHSDLDGVYNNILSMDNERSIISSIMNSGVTITPTYQPKKMVYESKNSKQEATEIVMILNSKEELKSLQKMLKRINYSATSGFVDSFPCVIYLMVNSIGICWGDNSGEDYKCVIKNDIKNNGVLDDVYEHPYTIKELDMVEKTLVDKKIYYRETPTYQPKKFIYESKNSKEEATEIGVILTSEEERNILQESLDKISYNANISYAKTFPCVVFLQIDHVGTAWSNQNGKCFKSIMSNDIESDELLDYVYKIPYTIRDINAIEKTLIDRKIHQTPRPTYEPKKFIYEKFNHKEETLVFEPSSPEECIKAQEIAFKHGWVWGDGAQEVQYSTKEECMFLTFCHSAWSNNSNRMFRVPEQHFVDAMEMHNDKIESLKSTTSDKIILTTNLRDFEKVLSDKPLEPSYSPKKFIYEKFNPGGEKALIFEPNNPEESEEAQKTSFRNGYLWGGGSNKIQFTDKGDGRFLMLTRMGKRDMLLRVPDSVKFKWEEDAKEETKIEMLQKGVSREIIYTNDINDFKKRITDAPDYAPKKFIY